MDLLALVKEKQKKTLENNKFFLKGNKGKVNTTNNKMPTRKAGRGK